MNFFKKFNKLNFNDKTKNKKLLSLAVTIFGIGIVITGTSAAYLLSQYEGSANKITAASLVLSLPNESEGITLSGVLPVSDEEGLSQDKTYNFTLENTGTIKMNYEINLRNKCSTSTSVTIDDVSVIPDICIPNEYIKVAVKKDDSDFEMIDLENIDKGVLDVNETIEYEMKIWLSEETPNDYQGIQNGIAKNVIYFGQLELKGEQIPNVILPNDDITPNKPNTPELATNMIPVTYDSENSTWLKADSTNSGDSWYNYDNKIWANAVTVKEENRDTYVKATPGTPISMDDINTMWVWIPRFNATIDGTFCSDIENVNMEDYPECYNEVIDLTEEEITTAVNDVYYLFTLEGETTSREEVRAMFEEAIEEKNESMLEQMLILYSNVLMIKDGSKNITISSDDRETINQIIGSDTLTQEFIDNGFSTYLLLMLLQQNLPITSTITFPRNNIVTKLICESEEKTDSECDLFVDDLNAQDNTSKMNFLYGLTTNEYVREYYIGEAEKIGYSTKFLKNNVIENTTPRNEDTYVCFDDNLFIDDNYKDRNSCEAAGYIWVDNVLRAINIRFSKVNEIAHDAFTFGTDELSGLWVAKFNVSHTTLLEETDYDLLGCTNETCENAKGIEILPNKVSLRKNNMSNIFYAIRSMEQTGNNYGLVSSEIDTHMMKNSEWGALSYFALSLYGLCTSPSSCTVMTQNRNDLTGYGSGFLVEEGEGEYNTSLGMKASTTGNIYGIYDVEKDTSEATMGVYTDGSRLWSGTSETDNSGFNGCLGVDCINSKIDGVDFPSDEKYYDLYTTKLDYLNLGLQHSMGEMPWSFVYGEYFVNSEYPWVCRDGGFNFSIFMTNNFSGKGGVLPFRPVLVKQLSWR